MSCVVWFRSWPWFSGGGGGVSDHWSCDASRLITCLDWFYSLVDTYCLFTLSRNSTHSACYSAPTSCLNDSVLDDSEITIVISILCIFRSVFFVCFFNFKGASKSKQMCSDAFKASLHTPLKLCVLAVWSSGQVIDCLACRLLVPSGPIDLPVWVNQWFNGSTRASSTAAACIDHLYPAFAHHHLSQFISLFSFLFLQFKVECSCLFSSLLPSCLLLCILLLHLCNFNQFPYIFHNCVAAHLPLLLVDWLVRWPVTS